MVPFDLVSTLRQIAAAPDMAGLETRLFAAVAPFGLTVGASGCVSGTRTQLQNTFHFVRWPAEVLERYIAEGMIADDPGPRWARATGRAALWSEIIGRLPEADPGRHVAATLTELGYAEGIVVPMRGTDGRIGLISLAGRSVTLDAATFPLVAAILATAFQAAEALSPSLGERTFAPILTQREIEILSLLVHGDSDKQIAAKSEISEATVRFHLKNIRHKFAATSRTHLAARAVETGFVST